MVGFIDSQRSVGEPFDVMVGGLTASFTVTGGASTSAAGTNR